MQNSSLLPINQYPWNDNRNRLRGFTPRACKGKCTEKPYPRFSSTTFRANRVIPLGFSALALATPIARREVRVCNFLQTLVQLEKETCVCIIN